MQAKPRAECQQSVPGGEGAWVNVSQVAAPQRHRPQAAEPQLQLVRGRPQAQQMTRRRLRATQHTGAVRVHNSTDSGVIRVLLQLVRVRLTFENVSHDSRTKAQVASTVEDLIKCQVSCFPPWCSA